MIGRKNTRLAIARWLRQQGVDCGTTIKLHDKFVVNGQSLRLVDASTTNTWGGTNGLVKLEVIA